MAYIGSKPADKVLTASDITDGIVSNAKLAQDIISADTELAVAPADTDEFLVSDAGTLKRIDYSLIKAANTPAFAAYASGDQTLTDNTWTKVPIDTEDFDTDSAFDFSTNYRWTPAVAGKYFIYGQTQPNQRLTAFQWEGGGITVYKNAAYIGPEQFVDFRTEGADSGTLSVSVVVDLDADDYVELYGKARALNDESCQFSNGNSIFGGFRLTGQ